jgi:hypothetical protein
LLAGTAEAVQRHAGHRLGPTCQQDGEPGDVVAVVTGQDAVARDDVVDLGGCEAGARGQRVQALREQGLRVDAVQSTVGAALAARCADGVENPGVDVALPSLRAFLWTASPRSARSVFSLSVYRNTALRECVLEAAKSSPSS